LLRFDKVLAKVQQQVLRMHFYLFIIFICMLMHVCDCSAENVCDASEKKLVFEVKRGTDHSMFWRTTVRIKCSKVRSLCSCCTNVSSGFTEWLSNSLSYSCRIINLVLLRWSTSTSQSRLFPTSC